MSRLDETIQAKKEKRKLLEEAGINPHPYFFDKQNWIKDCRQMEGQNVVTAGRVISFRTHGKVTFVDLLDSTGQIQVMLRETELGEEQYKILTKLVDAGDFLGVTGQVFVTNTGEITIQANKFEFLSKALRSLPTSWNKAEDKETRFRKRYIDMLVNPATKFVLDARWTTLREIRKYLQDIHGFIEVETPVLQPLYGGTNARPFTTHMNSLDCDFYLRVAPELYLKRLAVGGYERIFEIARNFRNEGIDQTHQPEFTMIEWYQAYADYHTMMDTAEGLIKHLIALINQNPIIKIGETEVNTDGTWPRITMIDALRKYAQIDFEQASDEQLKQILESNQIELIGVFTRGKALFALFDKLVTNQLIDPVWVIDYPRDVSPLAKKHRINPNMAERYELYIGGKELCDGWSELVDPIDQRSIFENEQKRMKSGDSEAHPMDEDFIEAMEYGLPPFGGIGMGIDRLVMFLTNTWSIKEVIAFPTLRPLNPILPIAPTQNLSQVVEEGASDDNFKQETNDQVVDSKPLPPRAEAQQLLQKYIQNKALIHHCQMVADAMSAYAKELEQDQELWYQTGLLHDLDWEMYPDEHPNKAVNQILTNYPSVLVEAIRAHAPGRTGKQPQTTIEKYLFACDELSGLMHAISLMRPNGFNDMEVKSVKKKLKDKSFASNVSREDINQGFDLIGKTADEHIGFLIEVFKN